MKRSSLLIFVTVIVTSAGCQAPPAAEEVLEPLAEHAEEISSFPASAGSLHRVQWDFGARSITAHYERDVAEAARLELPASAWVSRLVCQPEEQDPFGYADSRRLIAGLEASHPNVEVLDVSEEALGEHRFTVVYFAIEGDVGSEIGVIAATVLEPEDEKYHVLVARASRTEVIGLISFPGLSWLAELLEPILE